MKRAYIFNRFILNKNGTLTKLLREIAKITSISHDNTLESIVEATQHIWLRKKGTERWQIDDCNWSQISLLMPLLKQLKLQEPLYPQAQDYYWCLVLGDTVAGLVARLTFLDQLIRTTTRINKLVFLTGERYLTDQERDYLKHSTNLSTLSTETEAMLALLNTTNIAQALKGLPLIVIDTPATSSEQGVSQRPTTDDTIRFWLQTNPTPSSCLAISSQPFVPYQHLTLCTLLPPSFTIETVGPLDPGPHTNALYLDSLARWLYQELQLKTGV